MIIVRDYYLADDPDDPGPPQTMVALLEWFRRPVMRSYKVVDLDLRNINPLKDGDTLTISHGWPS